MTISFSGTGSDGEKKYNVSGSFWQNGASLSISEIANPSPVEEVKSAKEAQEPGTAEAQEMPDSGVSS